MSRTSLKISTFSCTASLECRTKLAIKILCELIISYIICYISINLPFWFWLQTEFLFVRTRVLRWMQRSRQLSIFDFLVLNVVTTPRGSPIVNTLFSPRSLRIGWGTNDRISISDVFYGHFACWLRFLRSPRQSQPIKTAPRPLPGQLRTKVSELKR